MVEAFVFFECAVGEERGRDVGRWKYWMDAILLAEVVVRAAELACPLSS